VDKTTLNKIGGGSNTPIFLIQTNKNKGCIVKQFGFELSCSPYTPRLNKCFYEKLFSDYIEIKEIVKKSGVNVPTTIDHYYIDDSLGYNEVLSKNMGSSTNVRLVVIENYCGRSLTSLVSSNELTSKLEELFYSQCVDVIKIIPNSIEVDTNPSNFTIEDNEVNFVDFMPPKIQQYQQIPEMVGLFPQIKTRELAREKRRIRRYTTTEGRMERFNYYFSQLKTNPFLPTPNH
jgi:hypothetical protein